MMGFNNQRDFNKFMDNYISRLPRNTEEKKALIIERPLPRPKPIPDKAEVLVEKELDKVEELSEGEGFLEKLKVFFFGRPPVEEDIKDVSDVDSYVDEVKKPMPAARPIQRVQSPYSASNSFSSSSQRAMPIGRVGASPGAPSQGRFEFNPDINKDIKYLTGLIESLIGKIPYQQRDKFLKSSEYRIYQDIKMRNR